MADLRSALEEAMAQAETGELEAPVEKEIEVEEQDSIASEAQQDEKPRDEKGRFKSESEEQVESDAQEVQAEEQTDEVEEPKPTLARPTTWKKDYLPIWDKLTTGQQLTPEEALKLAEYSNQREAEYKKGVSTYKAEADNARALREAIDPFMPELQANNISPAAWINNLGRAHLMLAKGTPEQKVQMFNKLAQDYGITLNNGEIAPMQIDPYQQQLMQQLQAMNQEVSTIKSRYEQEEQQRLMNEINRVAQDVERFPHFEELREQMAQLLEKGLASDLETAYAKAVRLNDDVWQQEQNRLLQQAKQEQAKAQKVAKAKAAAVSPKSVTPNGTVGNSGDKKDRRSLLAEKMGEADTRF